MEFVIFLELHGKDKVNPTKKLKMVASVCILQTINEIASKSGKIFFFSLILHVKWLQ